MARSMSSGAALLRDREALAQDCRQQLHSGGNHIAENVRALASA